MINRISWQVRQYKDSPYIHFYSDLSPVQQELLSTHVTPDAGAPVLHFSHPNGQWTLVCTRQIVGYDKAKLVTIAVDNIQAMMPPGYMHEPYQPKNELHELTVTDRQGQAHTLFAAPGTDLFTLWNLLRMIDNFYRE